MTLKKSLLTTIMLTSMLAAMPSSSHAIVACTSRDHASARLKEKHRESPVAIGINNEGRLVEVWSSPNGETWSITVTDARGLTCIVGAGKHWQRNSMPIDGVDG